MSDLVLRWVRATVLVAILYVLIVSVLWDLLLSNSSWQERAVGALAVFFLTRWSLREWVEHVREETDDVH